MNPSAQGNGLIQSGLPMANGSCKSNKPNLRCEEEFGDDASDESLEEMSTSSLSETTDPIDNLQDESLEEISTSSTSEVEDQELTEDTPMRNEDAVQKALLDRMSEISSVLESQYKRKDCADDSSISSDDSEEQSDLEIEILHGHASLNGKDPTGDRVVCHAGSNGTFHKSDEESGTAKVNMPKPMVRTKKTRENTNGKKRTRENADMTSSDSCIVSQLKHINQGDGDAQSDACKETKSILKVNGRERDGSEKKNVTWKKGKDLAKVVGVATGVGFDSVAMPDMAALMAMSMERDNAQGRRNARMRGRGRRISANGSFASRSNSNQSHGRGRGGRGRSRGGRRRKTS